MWNGTYSDCDPHSSVGVAIRYASKHSFANTLFRRFWSSAWHILASCRNGRVLPCAKKASAMPNANQGALLVRDALAKVCLTSGCRNAWAQNHDMLNRNLRIHKCFTRNGFWNSRRSFQMIILQWAMCANYLVLSRSIKPPCVRLSIHKGLIASSEPQMPRG